MKKEWLVKTLAICIIVLFISGSFQPVFANNIKSNDEKIEYKSDNEGKLEYIIEIIREDEIIQRSIFLTKEKANDLDIIIESIHSKLDNSKSNEDTVQIYYDSVDSYYDLGVFPDTISKYEIKQLVTAENREIDKIRFKNEMNEDLENRHCYITCNTTNTFSFGPINLFTCLAYIPYLVMVGVLRFFDHINISKFKIFYALIMTPYKLFQNIYFSLLNLSLSSINGTQPKSIGSYISFGTVTGDIFYPYYSPSNGWISTEGSYGNKSFNGDFYGQLSINPAPIFSYTRYCIGIAGFTGISIRNPDGYIFRQGYGLVVSIDSEHGV